IWVTSLTTARRRPVCGTALILPLSVLFRWRRWKKLATALISSRSSKQVSTSPSQKLRPLKAKSDISKSSPECLNRHGRARCPHCAVSSLSRPKGFRDRPANDSAHTRRGEDTAPYLAASRIALSHFTLPQIAVEQSPFAHPPFTQKKFVVG